MTRFLIAAAVSLAAAVPAAAQPAKPAPVDFSNDANCSACRAAPTSARRRWQRLR
jgi:hypothetical protein